MIFDPSLSFTEHLVNAEKIPNIDTDIAIFSHTDTEPTFNNTD